MISDPAKTNDTTFTGQMKEKWSALTDGDLEGIAGRKDPLVGKLRERYGYGQEQAEREADEFLHNHPELNGALNAPPSEPPLVQKTPPQARAELPSPVVPAVAPPVSSPPRAEEAKMTDAGYGHSVTIWISPRALRWTIAVSVAALFICLFLPWTGAYPSGYPAYTQNAFQMILGGVSDDPVAIDALGAAKPYDNVEKNPLMLFYVLFVMLAVLLVVLPMVLTPAYMRAFHPIIQSIWRRRVGLLASSALLTFVILMTQLWMGFGLENAIDAKADKSQSVQLAAAKTPEEKEKANIRRGLEVSPFNVGHTDWLYLAVFSNVLLLGGVGLDYWLTRRGSRPLPRLDAHA